MTRCSWLCPFLSAAAMALSMKPCIVVVLDTLFKHTPLTYIARCIYITKCRCDIDLRGVLVSIWCGIYGASKISLACEFYVPNYMYLFSSPEKKAHGELIVYQSSRRPSVRASVSASVHIFKHEYLRNQRADHNEILSEASFGLGKSCIRFRARSYQNSGFHGNR